MKKKQHQTKSFREYQRKSSLLILRPVTLAAAIIWLWFALEIDTRLHPEIPSLIFYRMGFFVVSVLVFLCSFHGHMKQYAFDLLKVTYLALIISSALITGRLFIDPNYVSGLQIVVIVSMFLPFPIRAIAIFHIVSVIIFFSTAIKHNIFPLTIASYYSLHNLFLGYVISGIGVFIMSRYRYKLFLDQLKLEEMATIDSLTQIYNRRSFFKSLDLEFQKSVRYNQPITVIAMDLDYFKKINDIYGHPAGDHVLKEFARICKQQIREFDILGRLGGEEFSIILPQTKSENAKKIAERIRLSVAENDFSYRTDTITVTVSIGMASFPQENMKYPDELMKKADEFLYLAKNQGRNRVIG